MNARKNPETPWLLVEIRKVQWDITSEIPYVVIACIFIVGAVKLL